ncbi:RluA family pseudouridine synthase [Paenalcaligenes sp. Me131]|uniref:RluA family pseudouridine synthase n=1 Tax=Paenalcaligenes sp. Me131 TaxID=3392636 RepID=UPI003D2D4876
MPLLCMSKPLDSEKGVVAVRFVEIEAEEAGQRVDNYLLRLCKGVPKSHIYRAIRSGQVRVNKGRISSEYRLEAGDVLRVPPMRLPQVDAPRHVPPAVFPIVYEDRDILVIDKPEGVAVHGGSGVSFGVIEQLRSARPEERVLELAHRLDRDTSGLLVIAKSRKALVRLHDMFREGVVRKHYQALVTGDWVNDRQHLREPLLRWMTASGERRVRVDPEGKPSHTIVNLLKRFGRYSLVEADLRTGRTHQIRVHLANAGYPLVGDDKYGSDEVREHFSRLGFKRMFLHAGRVEMAHPVSGELLKLEAPLPAECVEIMKILEKAE